MRLLAGLMLIAAVRAADDAPSWVREAATAPMDTFDKTVPAAFILNEESVAVEENGRMVSTRRAALKILTVAGKQHANARAFYTTGSGRIRDMRGWVLYASGDVKKLGKDEIADLSAADNDVYNEVRLRFLNAGGLADPNSVFAYEIVSEERSVFSQRDWDFQDELPVRLSRFSITAPAGWKVDSKTFNHAAIEPQTAGGVHTWQLRGLDRVPDERSTPGLTTLIPRVAVSLTPPQGAATMVPFAAWSDVSTWLAGLHDTQTAMDPALKAKAESLAASGMAPIDKIRAIGKFTQQVRYVSIQTGIGRGGGYKPHAASEVLAKNYGDCKDKANLMRTLLGAAGIEAWPVSVYSGNSRHVRAEWPSPQQFNHEIVAVRAPQGFDAPAVAEHPALGRLLFFDPTADHVALGHLPIDLYNSHGLMIRQTGGALVRLPEANAATNRERRTTTAQVDATGGVRAAIVDDDTGWPAFSSRSSRGSLSPVDYKKAMERAFAAAVPGSVLESLESLDDGGETFRTEVRLSAQAFGKVMQNRLLMFRAMVAPRGTPGAFVTKERKLPVALYPFSYDDQAVFELPPGFEVDELPPVVKTRTEFGAFEFACSEEASKLNCAMKLDVPAQVVPVEKYAAARAFFGLAGGVLQTPVVLIRK